MKIKSTALRCIGLLLLLLIVIGCTRRPLEDEFFETALIPVTIDWSKSGIPQNTNGVYDMHRATIRLFPHNAGEPILDFRLEGDLTHRDIEVPAGVYSVIIFNETIDESDWSRIYFSDVDNYHSFAAHAKPETQKGFYTQQTEEALFMQPEPLAAWALERFEVTADMVGISRNATSKGRELGGDASLLTTVYPLPRSARVKVIVRVINLSGATQTTGIVKGVVTGMMMASGTTIDELGAHATLLNGRQMEENGRDGRIGSSMSIFGLKADVDYTFKTDFLLTDGTLFSPPTVSSPNLFTQSDDDESLYLIDIGIGSSTIPGPGDPEPEPDIPPLVLPPMDTQADVEIGSWEDVTIPLN